MHLATASHTDGEIDVTPSHRFEEHTGEVRLYVEAPSLASLFEEAARALAELMLEEANGSTEEPVEKMSLHAPDRDALLVDFLNELVFLSETRRRIYTDVRVHALENTDLCAEAKGVSAEAVRTAVKAATLHGLHIEHGPSGFSVSVVLDV